MRRLRARQSAYHLCQHGHPASRLLPGSGADVGTGLEGVTEWHICDGSRQRGGQASDQDNTVGQADAGDPGDRSDEGHAVSRPDP